jgi:glycosyltransferase involved in cell wall biosynthesis
MLVSIITVVFNGEREIERTLKSVISQKSKEIEYIIIDGGSSDDTLKVITHFNGKIDKFLSEPDNGIYDAMNKGIAIASGKYICFINAGDILVEIPIEKLQIKDADMHCFPVLINGNSIRYPRLNCLFKVNNTLPHQGIFYKKQSFLKFDTSYKVFADYALNADYVEGKKKIQLWREPTVAKHILDGISNNKSSSIELFQLVREKFGLLQLVISFIYFKVRGLYFRLHLLCF